MEKFSEHLHDKIGYYVYFLIDPRNNKIFYVGKGHGNRVFDHAKGAIKGNDPVHPEKNELIREIINSGKEVIPMIARWNLTEKEAYILESILIDIFTSDLMQGYSNMTMQVKGHDSSTFGLQSPKAVEEKLTRGNIDKKDINHNVIAISIKESLEGPSLYERIRGNWNMSIERAKKADYVFAVRDGVIIGIFNPEKWESVTADEGKRDVKRNWIRFTGKEVEDEGIIEKYLHKKLPAKAKGNSNPITYYYL